MELGMEMLLPQIKKPTSKASASSASKSSAARRCRRSWRRCVLPSRTVRKRSKAAASSAGGRSSGPAMSTISSTASSMLPSTSVSGSCRTHKSVKVWAFLHARMQVQLHMLGEHEARV